MKAGHLIPLSLSLSLALGLKLLLGSMTAMAYPLIGSEDRKIGRVEAARLVQDGVVEGREKVSGELLSLDEVDLRLLDKRDMRLPAADKDFTRELRDLLGNEADDYSLAVLDATDLTAMRYGEHNGTVARNPGSVGKIAVGLALFQALADAYPEDSAKRMDVLRDTRVVADEFIISDSHTVRKWDAQKRKLTRAALRLGDAGSLIEYLDWMLSASSNAAAAMVMRETLLLKQFATQYPPTQERGVAFFKESSRGDLGKLLEVSLQEPMVRNGIDISQFRQGSLFTRTGKQKVPGTNSYGTVREMMNFLLRMEQGHLVDEWSSRELKRMLYMTERRIRYASASALRDAAVYFKSGSWYQCVPEEGFKCGKYHGNKLNLMNSIAIVEAPAKERKLYYLVTLTSNVLRKNSAVDHQTLATRIHRLIEKAHNAR
jgi:hypothetical protein